MPELLFHVRWPDGSTEACYSPSLVVAEHLEAGASYPVAEFVERARTALTIGSDRVEARYGFPCRSALGQLASIEVTAARMGAGGEVRVVRFGA